MEKLKSGFTTGSCVAATSKAALESLFTNNTIKNVSFNIPRGDFLNLAVFEVFRKEGKAAYGIKKYSGDDPDVTNGALIISKVELLDKEGFENKKSLDKWIYLGEKVLLRGGDGVGLVTKPGLAANVGEPAINPVPRKMVREIVEAFIDDFDYDGYIFVEIFIPRGEELAKQTFNGNLGIVGGISILGTSGIVSPMSEQALIDTIEVEMKVSKACGVERLIITPGNYGRDYLKLNSEIDDSSIVKCSNFIGDALRFAGEQGFGKVLLSGHLGKLIKVAGGVLNTHSKYGDRRMEIIIDYAKRLCPREDTIKEIERAVMVDEAIRILDEEGIRNEVMKLIVEDIEKVMTREIKKVNRGLDVNVGTLIFSNKYGLLGKSENIYHWLQIDKNFK